MKPTLITLLAFVIGWSVFLTRQETLFGNQNLLNKKNMEETVKLSAGIEVFLKKPQQYSFLCTPTSKGEVLSAKLFDSNKMEIEYASFWADGDHSGKVVGVYKRKTNHFKGVYKTNDHRFSGEINFSFNEKGEANGSWDNGYGRIRIQLKK